MFLKCLRRARKAAGLNQREVAGRLQESILFVSRCERGERRMDIVELRAFCRAIGKSPAEFMRELDRALDRAIEQS